MAQKATMTLSLDRATQDRLRWMAKEMGLTIGRGKMADEGSIRQLLERLAVGDAGYLILEDIDFELAKDVDFLAQQLEKDKNFYPPMLAELLRRVGWAMIRARFMYATSEEETPDGDSSNNR